MTQMNPTSFPSNLLEERYLCVEWAYNTGLLGQLATVHPLVRINKMTVRQYLDRAVGYLVQMGVSLREIWEIADLVAPEAFAKIIEAARAQSPATAQCMAIVLITTAREWVAVDDDHIAELEKRAGMLSGVAFKRHHERNTQIRAKRLKCVSGLRLSGKRPA